MRVLGAALGTIQAATDLLEKRGAIYSSRPRSIVANEILNRNMRGLPMPYGQRWRNWRAVRLAHRHNVCRPLQETQTSYFRF